MKQLLFLLLSLSVFYVYSSPSQSMIASVLDSEDRRILQEDAPSTLNRIERKEQLSFYDIKKLAKIGISNDKIIEAIHSTDSIYYLTPADVEELKRAGVSKRIIRTMKKTSTRS